MYRKIGATCVLAAGLGLMSGCTSMCNHPLFHKKKDIECPATVGCPGEYEVGPSLDGCAPDGIPQIPPAGLQATVPQTGAPPLATGPAPKLVTPPGQAPNFQYKPQN